MFGVVCITSMHQSTCTASLWPIWNRRVAPLMGLHPAAFPYFRHLRKSAKTIKAKYIQTMGFNQWFIREGKGIIFPKGWWYLVSSSNATQGACSAKGQMYGYFTTTLITLYLETVKCKQGALADPVWPLPPMRFDSTRDMHWPCSFCLLACCFHKMTKWQACHKNNQFRHGKNRAP